MKEKLQNQTSSLQLHLTLGLSLPSPGLPAFLMAEVLLGRKALLAPAAWEVIHLLLHIRCAEAAVNLSVFPVSILTASLM